MDPVSYTHLDVYKRQALAHPEDMVNYPKRHGNDFYHHYKEDIKLFAEMGFKVFRMSIASVSYTHLDVYKRQVLFIAL